MRPLKIVLTILLTAAICSCRSHKAATESHREDSVEMRTATAMAASSEELRRLTKASRWKLTGITIEMATADSTGSGTAAPSIKIEEAMLEETTEAETQAKSDTARTATAEASRNGSEAQTYKPPDTGNARHTLRFLVAAAACAAALWLLSRKK